MAMLILVVFMQVFLDTQKHSLSWNRKNMDVSANIQVEFHVASLSQKKMISFDY